MEHSNLFLCQNTSRFIDSLKNVSSKYKTILIHIHSMIGTQSLMGLALFFSELKPEESEMPTMELLF